MGSSLVEVDSIGIEEPMELLLMEDQEMIQAFSPHTSQEAFTDAIGSRRSVWRAKDFDVTCCGHSCKMLPEFAVIIPDQIGWGLPIRCGLSQLLRHPGISRRSRHVHMDHLARLQFDDEKGKQRTEEEVGHLQKITGPYACCMIAQECFPHLPTSVFWTDLLHILLDGPFTHMNIQFEQFTPNAFRSPQSIVRCHRLDQADCFEREPRLSRRHF